MGGNVIEECDAVDDGFYCTEAPDHEGPHVALGLADEVCHTWPQLESS